jgi:hypothetical protein
LHDGQLDLEADLGLNSISRVEVLGAFRRRVAERGELGELGDVDFERLTAQRTVQQILDVLAPAAGRTAEKAEV